MAEEEKKEGTDGYHAVDWEIVELAGGLYRDLQKVTIMDRLEDILKDIDRIGEGDEHHN